MIKNILTIVITFVWLQQIVYTQNNNIDVSKYAYTLNLIEQYYLDTVNAYSLTEYAIKGLIKELDPHSGYMTKKEMKDMEEPLKGNFEGIGVQFNIIRDTIVVVAPITGGPSEKLGILSGDKIVKIENENAASIGITNKDVIDKLRGEKGSEVNISIYRRGEKKLLDFTIVRDKIPIYSLDASYMAAPDVGYIKINRFGATTMNEYQEALAELTPKGMKHLILDLRSNSGGYLQTAIQLADEFLNAGKLIVYTEGINSPRSDSYATSHGQFITGKVVVLIDGGSASASEIVSGAIQDWDRGLIVGRRSFGKGLVQKPFRLPDGSTLKLTVAQYFTPSGRCIQIPYEKGVDKYYEALRKRYETGELFSEDSIPYPDSLTYQTLINKRTVYGGGGIIPDIFIPLDTTSNTPYLTTLYRKGVFNQFAFDYVDIHRDELKKNYPSADDFVANFEVTNKFMGEFMDYVENKGIEKNNKDFKISEKMIKNNLKAWLGRQLWSIEEYFRIVNTTNKEYIKALKIIENDTFDRMNIHYN